jgi:AcrR family transcriptional regulator
MATDVRAPSTTPTALERALHSDEAPARATPLDALRLARRGWLEGGRLDMGTLAKELGIGRATLYTWVGSKERLLGEVLWSFAEEGLRQARAAAVGTGADYIADVFERFERLNAGFAPLRRFLEQDPELALRLLTSKHGPIQERMIAAARALLAEQIEAGALAPALDPDTLAYVMIRIAESFTYSDLITGSEPDVEKAVEVVRVLLQAQPAEAQPRSHARGRSRAGR